MGIILFIEFVVKNFWSAFVMGVYYGRLFGGWGAVVGLGMEEVGCF